ncbi:MAG: aminotransferase class III-fold pyridoxal phosphate-dependent enzyme [Alphaproteobacteria bacterium]|jgi:glutamate-1-semialdehyde aminotransferase/spore coat polysaccharide biosynthesis protein SpsF (cytidylyltransferase family)|nr:aminotransferase class III-fold pyridoxal phosphate-dependent enzyme [Alphaproteobacteria bacterium]MBT5389768.1 aminotransferase class III-fold pyridoxal phosphate-dependent enzyme [Alphaproteobacteria bacterium]MBT5540862.1 aminotransferase class III-fold pyridoxal phosphate-dependent enzyme [Alphaproteobacteria bacterium]MBT5654522.1 aminotransferase class III-fold pyridoxal phosphate-dependent enzyme [Alphaproteobacteria bacterium]
MKKVAIIQARMGSTRFPGKVLKELAGKPLLEWIVTRSKEIPLIDQVVVATSDQESDLPIVQWCKEHKVECFRGNEHDVLDRYYNAAQKMKADVIIRITADCPFLDPNVAGQVLSLVALGHADYASNILPVTWPDGLDCEAFTFSALESSHRMAVKRADREHVTSYIRNNQAKFKVLNLSCPLPDLGKYRWTIDTSQDLEYLETICKKVGKDFSSYVELLSVLGNEKQPSMNRNEGYAKSIRDEKTVCSTFTESDAALKRSLKVIPLGSQTFSKSHIQYPKRSPLFLSHGMGGRVWDVDGNEYVDLVSGLLPSILGYSDPDVNYAIQEQLQKGITFSLATSLEIELAEKLCRIIPSAEQVRFSKNGSDVTSAAIRLARAYTQRDKVVTCGYHGWHDWYVGTTTRDMGVPKSVSELTVSVPFNDIDRFETLLKTEEYASVIIEPCNMYKPQEGFLQTLKVLCERYGTLLVFDEIITGFRMSLGGAQEYFDVTPHISCFGKAMGNGMPISAIVGSKKIMKSMEDIFFSGTFGGETISIAAALATINVIEKKNVIGHLWDFGQRLSGDAQQKIKKYGLSDAIQFCGYAPWKIIKFSDVGQHSSHHIKTYFMQEMIKHGVLINSSHNICYPHDAEDFQAVLDAYEVTLESLSSHLKNNKLSTSITGPVVEPVFSVR